MEEGTFTISKSNIESLAGQRAAEFLCKSAKFWDCVERGTTAHIRNIAYKTLSEYENKVKGWTAAEYKAHQDRFKKKLKDTIDGNLKEASEEAKKQIRDHISSKWAQWRYRISDKWFEDIAKECLAIHIRKSFGRTANQIAKDMLATYKARLDLLSEGDLRSFKGELYRTSNEEAERLATAVLGGHMDRLQLLLRERLEEEAEREFGKDGKEVAA